MKTTTVRRVGNSLGVLVPRSVLRSWGVAEGDAMEITERAIRPARRGNAHEELDAIKLSIALEVVRRFSADQIRAKILANLYRWEAIGSWVSAYDEWRTIAQSVDDGALFCAMLGSDDRANRLRQSAPYVGLLTIDVMRRLNEETAG